MEDGGETKLMQGEEEESKCLPNASLLPQLNLAIVVLSVLSSSSEDGLYPEKVIAGAKGDNEYEANNVYVKKLHTRRKGINAKLWVREKIQKFKH